MNNPAATTILIADYEGHILDACLSRLRAGEFKVVTVRDGREALGTALTICPAIVSASIFLPKMSGIELCQRLRHDGRTESTHIILLSRMALLPWQQRRARQAGCNSLLIEPHLPDALCDAVHGICVKPVSSPLHGWSPV